FWSVRVNADIRLIVHKTEGSLLLCYVDHHDAAYHWAERRKLQTHPKTGAAQLVEVREVVQTITVPNYVESPQPQNQPAPFTSSPLLGHLSHEELLSYGVPAEWLDDVHAADADSLLTLVEHLPAEAAEALLELATGGKPRVAVPFVAANPFAHPDARRRFRVMSNVEELQQALDFPWEKWTIFLHPEQRQLVEREYAGPARVAGSAGTGKTIVALHRAAWLARKFPDVRILLTTFSDTLAYALQTRLSRLLSHEPRLAERIDAESLPKVGQRLYRAHGGTEDLVDRRKVIDLIRESSEQIGEHKFSLHFLVTEWEQIVDAWQLKDWEAYQQVPRLGRKTRLPEAQREILWKIFQRVQERLSMENLVTQAGMFTTLSRFLENSKHLPYEFAVIDEAQDISVSQLRFLAALAGKRENGLFFAGDLGQRIFQTPFSWKSLGVDIRGRSRTLRVNYRTSHQIRTQADKLLGPEMIDVDGNKEERNETVSIFNGPPPVISILKD
ncbi:MAG: UvrD-helicase domain-containing protein, partial [Planctomycetaceae bacterium]|nr:UvrD-helicase domain-containing protein [Planctomycetaceae bacterium]